MARILFISIILKAENNDCEFLEDECDPGAKINEVTFMICDTKEKCRQIKNMDDMITFMNYKHFLFHIESLHLYLAIGVFFSKPQCVYNLIGLTMALKNHRNL